jgi:iron complex transport system ATP-binding protein
MDGLPIEVRDVGFAYGDRNVLHDLSFGVRQGETLAILGPNGCGKSTLLALLRGVLAPTRGQIRLFGGAPGDMRRAEVARRVAVVPQMLSPTFGFSVLEFVGMGRYPHLGAFGAVREADRRAVKRAMDLTDTTALASRPVMELSGGEFQRVALARAVAQEAAVLLLDEITSHLDLDHTVEVANLLLRLNRDERITVVQVSHDLGLASQTSHRLLLLDRSGGVVAVGPPEQVLTQECLARVYRAPLTVERDPTSGRARVFPLLGQRAG